MAGHEVYVIAALAIIGGFLLLRYRVHAQRRVALAGARGLDYVERGLNHLPPEFMRTVLFAVADGGHESHVATGELDLDGHSVSHTVFELRFQRDVRGEWAYLTTSPAFRIHSPVTVLAYVVERDFPHTLIKARGPSLLVAERDIEAFTSLANLARDISGIERAMEVEPPNGISKSAIPFARLAEEYFVWSADADDARDVVDADVQALLLSPASGGDDITIELLGPLLILYRASNGKLAPADVLAVSSFGDELCRCILASTKMANAECP